MSTITAGDVAANTDFSTTSALNEDTGVDAFMTMMGVDPKTGEELVEDASKKKKKPSEEVETNEDDAPNQDADKEEASDESPEDETDEATEEETEQDDDETETKKSYVDSDDTYVKVKIGDEEKEVSVKDLKRLYGQEASLTRKSQEVAAQRKEYDDGVAKNLAALNIMLEKAQAKAKPYANIDWLAAAKNPNISAEELSGLQAEAKAAFEEVQFFEKDLGSLMTTLGERQKTETAAKAKAAVQALSTPGTDDKPNPLYIEGWNDRVYDDLRSFARELGADAQSVDAMVDPVAFKVLHMALQFKKGSSKVLTVKTKKSPTKILKTSTSAPAAKASNSANDRAKAISNLKRSGSEEDAIAAFLTSMGGENGGRD